jgi:hypothetical protein
MQDWMEVGSRGGSGTINVDGAGSKLENIAGATVETVELVVTIRSVTTVARERSTFSMEAPIPRSGG